MRKFRERKSWIVFIAVLLLFAACKGESPTAPPPGGGVPPGSTPPPTGVVLTLTTTNSSPLVDSTVTITASATIDGAAVPNGTAVEFTSNGGTLTGGTTSVVRTTTNGSATVTLTSGTTGVIRVSATLNNVTRTIDITFVARPIVTPPPNTAPTISSITPSIVRPSGGEVIRITGTNFRSPVRVLFDTGQALPVEGQVVGVTETTIDVITPPINLGTGQQQVVDVIVLTQAGSTTEQRVEVTGGITYRNVQLTPVMFTVTPNSGPVTGGTRVTIIGEAFQEPVQVLFDTAEARVLNVTYNQILVETPAARDTAPTGSGTVVGPVTVSVTNINSNKTASLAAAFNYKAAMQITGVTVVSNSDGTARLTIDGIGFVAPLIAVIRTGEGDVSLSQISVAGTRIIAIAPRVIPESCGQDLEGPVVVTNIVNGDTATGPIYRFPGFNPAIVNISPSVITVGTNSTFTVRVFDAVPGVTRFTVGTRTVFPTAATDNGDGSVTFTVPVPTNLVFPTEACPGGGARQLPLEADVTYDSSTSTGCSDVAAGALTINPAANTPILTITPASFAPFSARITPAVADPDGPGPLLGTPASVAPSGPQTVNVTNTGTGTLTINSVTAGPGCTNFTVSSPSTPTNLAPCDPFPVTAVYNGQTTAGTQQCTVTLNTSAGTRTLTLSGTSQ